MIEEKQRYIVAMLGARMHYAVPRILNAAGMLERFYTDGYVSPRGRRWLMAMPEWFMPVTRKRLASRFADGLPADKIRSFGLMGLWYRRRLHTDRGEAARRESFMIAGRKFCDLVRRESWGSAGAVYAWNSAALEIFQEARKRGVRTVLEQCSAPREMECRIMESEHARHPGWEEPFEISRADREYAERERMEWQFSDCILCPSEFVRNGIGELGGPVERCQVVPYGVDIKRPDFRELPKDSGKLRVLSVGRVSLAKGVAIVAAAGKSLTECAEFRFVGESRLLPDREVSVRQDVELVGAVPISEIWAHYHWADVFLLPSLHEGSATVCYEALSCGLPVICTPNTGSVVTDGYDGFIVDPLDVGGIVKKLRELADKREMLAEMRANALRTSLKNTLDAYGQRLVKVLGNLRDCEGL